LPVLGCPKIFDLGLYFTAAAREPSRLLACRDIIWFVWWLMCLYISVVSSVYNYLCAFGHFGYLLTRSLCGGGGNGGGV